MTVAAIVMQSEQITPLLNWSSEFAAVSDQDVQVFVAGRFAEALAGEVQEYIKATDSADVTITMEALEGSPTSAIHLVSAVNGCNPELTLLCKLREPRLDDPERTLTHQLFKELHSPALILRPSDIEAGGKEDVERKDILVPVAGGPHSQLALRIGAGLSRHRGGKITALSVVSNLGEVSRDVAHLKLGEIIKEARLEEGIQVERQVVIADDVSEGISRALEGRGIDLVVLGASNTGVLRRLLFGTIPERLLLSEDGLAIGIARAGHPVLWRMQRGIERILDLTVPQLEREQRITLFENLHSGARWNFDFLALITLSTAIATMGLLQNSTAVVIGAMLVAPLMTPLLAAGLALLQGNLPLMKESARAILYGFLTALVIAYLIAALTPIDGLTPEIVNRAGPGVLDMEIALLSGMAAAYCSARPGLSAALPGVAIAAALVPPIAATGIALSAGQGSIARGAALLFLTNIVAIILGAVVSFYGGGIRSLRDQGERQMYWAKRTLAALVLALAVLFVPLSSVIMSKAPHHDSALVTFKKQVEAALLDNRMPPGVAIARTHVNIREGIRTVSVYVNARRPLNGWQVRRLTRALRKTLRAEDLLYFHTLLVNKVNLQDAGAVTQEDDL